jgi:hypothetical protein
MAVDTLEIAKKLEAEAWKSPSTEAVTQVLSDLVYDDLVTRDYLDSQLLQHTIAVVASLAAIAGLSKLFGS